MSAIPLIVFQNSGLSRRGASVCALAVRWLGWFGGFRVACGCSACRGQWGWGTAEQFGETSEALFSRCHQHFVPDPFQAPQPKPVDPENAFHMGKPHLDLLAFAARLLEGFRTGQRADAIAHILVEIARDFARNRRGTLWLQ